MSHDSGDDRFAPERIDDTIDAALSARRDGVATDQGARLVGALRGAYTLPPATATAVLERVRERLHAEMAVASPAGEPARVDGGSQFDGDDERPEALTPLPMRHERRGGRVAKTLRAIAAVLVVALLLGAFYAVTQGRGPGRSKGHGLGQGATVTSATPAVSPALIGTWQDAAISSANANGRLDFNPSGGVAYAVAQTNGYVYACGGGHLWYSVDGGGHYSVFTPALPASFAAQITGGCTMTTVQGWPGLFIAPNGDYTGRSVLYATPGDAAWQKLIMSGMAPTAANPAIQYQVDGGQIWRDLFQPSQLDSLTPPAAASGQWLYFEGAANQHLIGTNDLGRSWVDFSASDTGSGCGNFAVDPTDPGILACQVTGKGGVAETTDAGKSWTLLTGGANDSAYLMGMSGDTIYATYSRPTYTEHILTHAITSGVWVDRGSVHVVSMGGPVAVTPDGALYFPALDDQTASQFGLYVYTPGALGLRQTQGFETIPGNMGGVRLFGGLWPGSPPAVYTMNTFAASKTATLYRMFLPAATAPSVVETPTATTQPTATPIGNVACTQAPGNLASIQSGGIGADFSTLATRWGGTDGAAAGSLYFGHTSKGTPQVQAPNGYGRAYGLIYNVDPAQPMTITQATALAQTILPTDAAPLTALRYSPASGNNPPEYQRTYCSAAYLAIAPTSQQGPLPVPRNGVIQVSYVLNADGSVLNIDFWPVQ